MPDQSGAAGGHPLRAAPQAARWSSCTNRGGSSSPKLDTKIEVDDSLRALRLQAIRSTTGSTCQVVPVTYFVRPTPRRCSASDASLNTQPPI